MSKALKFLAGFSIIPACTFGIWFFPIDFFIIVILVFWSLLLGLIVAEGL